MPDLQSLDISRFTGKRIAVLMGGLSSEREISLRSGKNISQTLKNLGLSSIEIDVDRNLSSVLSREKIDLAVIALHGHYGEDGCIQGLLEVMNIPYTCSGVAGSAIGMNKFLTKKILLASGLPVPKHEIIDVSDLPGTVQRISQQLGFPTVLKPMEEGSSVGVEMMDNEDQLRQRLPGYAQEFGNSFAEQFVQGRELTVGVLGKGVDLTVFPILELHPKKRFYDFEAKYTKGLTEFVIPAEISPEMTRKVQDLTAKGFTALGLSGVARLDLILTDDGTPYFLEANTVPGFTETSDIPAMARAQGMSFEELVLRIMELAL